MGVRRAAPGSQVLSDFEVISCPWRAASADQGSLYGTLLRKKTYKFFCSNPKQQNFWETAISPKISVRTRFEQKNLLVSFSKRDYYMLSWSAEAALQGQLITSKSDRNWLPGATLVDPILKGATLTPRLVHDLLNVNLAIRVRVCSLFYWRSPSERFMTVFMNYRCLFCHRAVDYFFSSLWKASNLRPLQVCFQSHLLYTSLGDSGIHKMVSYVCELRVFSERTRIYMDLSCIDPQSQVLDYSFK